MFSVNIISNKILNIKKLGINLNKYKSIILLIRNMLSTLISSDSSSGTTSPPVGGNISTHTQSHTVKSSNCQLAAVAAVAAAAAAAATATQQQAFRSAPSSLTDISSPSHCFIPDNDQQQQRALQLAIELSMMGLNDAFSSTSSSITSSSVSASTISQPLFSGNEDPFLILDYSQSFSMTSTKSAQLLQLQIEEADLVGNGLAERSKKSQNMTECVPVPSSEHVAEIVGRQGCKIKALRAKTNTYIKTPVRGEEPVFVVTGRKEDVAKAKREILSAAEHFSLIRASRKPSVASSTGSSTSLLAATVGSTIAQAAALAAITATSVNQQQKSNRESEKLLSLNQVTIQVRVPYRVVGLVVGPKGATIKQIQQQTHTYIVTPSRDKEPVFEITGLQENVQKARRQIEAHIAIRTGNTITGNNEHMDATFRTNTFDNNVSSLIPNDGELLASLYKNGIGSLFGYLDEANLLGSNIDCTSAWKGLKSNTINGPTLELDEGIGESPTNIWSNIVGATINSDTVSPTDSLLTQPTLIQQRRDCVLCQEKEIVVAFLPCGHNLFCIDCANRICGNIGELAASWYDGKLKAAPNSFCPICNQNVNQVIQVLG